MYLISLLCLGPGGAVQESDHAAAIVVHHEHMVTYGHMVVNSTPLHCTPLQLQAIAKRNLLIGY
jgi:hypothetical protein